MSDEHLHEKWVPEVADREAAERPDQEWLPEHTVVEGFDREADGHYTCQWCAARVPGTQAAIDEHRATHA